jgi:putative SOS response-associated peptidase YedK
MAKIHNIKKRQPVILNPEDQNKWLGAGLNYDHILDGAQSIDLTAKIVTSPLKYKN